MCVLSGKTIRNTISSKVNADAVPCLNLTSKTANGFNCVAKCFQLKTISEKKTTMEILLTPEGYKGGYEAAD